MTDFRRFHRTTRHLIHTAPAVMVLFCVTSWSAAQDQNQAPTAAAPAITQAQAQAQAQAEPVADVSVAFKDMPVEQVCQFIGKRLDKPVIADDSVKQKRISIISDKKYTLEEALKFITVALRQEGVIYQEYTDHIEFLPISELPRTQRPVIPADQSVTQLADRSQIVDKVFAVKHYDAMKLNQVIVSMLPDFAFVVVDPNVNRLIVTDTVENLIRIEQVVARLDVPMADQAQTAIIPMKNQDAAEVLATVKLLIAATLGREGKDLLSTPGRVPSSPGQPQRRRGGPPRPPGQPSSPSNGQPGSVFVEQSKAPILLQADVARNAIIAVAPASIMVRIREWVAEFDVPRAEQDPFEVFTIEYADIDEVAQQLMQFVQAMGPEVQQNLTIVPLSQSRKLMVRGSPSGRALIGKLLKHLDVKSSTYQQTREFILQHDNAKNVKSKIDDLYGTDMGTNRGYYWLQYMMNTGGQEKVKVSADTQRNTVTVVTDPARMREIEDLVHEWDRPLNLDDVRPKTYHLEHADPVKVETVLDDMFNKRTSRTSYNFYDVQQEESTPVGPLFGQFSFQALPDSNILIVTTTSSSNYKVIDELIAEIDQPQTAGLPDVVPLKHAYAEDLAEQLNALLSEPGALAEIRRSQRGLSESVRQSTADQSSGRTQGANPSQGDSQRQQNPNNMRFWWSDDRQVRTDEERPSSNLIGKPRFVPINRINGLMILAPRAYMQPIHEIIDQLDRPGMQVVIRAIIVEIQYDDQSTLGTRIASDPSILRDPRLFDQSFGGGAQVDITRAFDNGVFTANINMNLLVQLLMKKLNARILFEPKLYTVDNEEAHFFDGQDVPYQVRSQSSPEGASISQDIDYRPVGTRLHVRPHITEDGEVDLLINLELSRIVNGGTVFGNFIFDRRETWTNIKILDGQTVMISGIIEQEDFEEVRKIPLLGDIPLLGPAIFRSTDKTKRNREVIAFISPRVVHYDQVQTYSEENVQKLDQMRTAPTDGKNK